MYLNPKSRQRSPLLRITVLSILVIGSVWFLRQIIDGKEWARPFDPTPTPTLPAIAHINQGDIFFAEGQLYKAMEVYEKAIELEPENDIPYRQVAHLLVYLGDTAGALIRAEQAVLLNPTSAENLASYCQALDWEGDYGSAAEACECAMELDPDYAPAYAYLAEVYADQGLWGPAKSTAQEAISINFQSPEAHHNMGYALEVQGRYREAVEFYENAVTLRPKLAPFYLSAGQSYYSLGQFDKAADRFGEAIKLNPTDPIGYDQIGWTYFANGEPARAIDALEQAIGVDANHARAWGRLATIYYQRQNYEEAIKNFPIAIELAERQFLRRAREIEVYTEIEGLAGPESVPILRGRFDRSSTAQVETLIATISPIEWLHRAPIEESVTTCGHLIARNIQNQTIHVSPNQNIRFSQTFSQTSGTATLNLASGELMLVLDNLPRPQALPYEVKIRYRPNLIKDLGFIQPDAAQKVDMTFVIESESEAPVTYYYGLGLSYVYMDPPQCNEAMPWLIKAVKKDPAFYNPGWAGFKICPSDDAPPTPLPTFTPTPEEVTP